MERTRMTWRALALAIAVPVGLAALGQAAWAQEAEASVACELQVDPAAVPAQAEAVTLSALLTAEIGQTLSARLEEGSGVQVVAVQPARAGEDDSPAVRAVSVTLNTADAVAGEWALTLEDEDGRQCTGSVQVQSTEGSGR